jgi:hypothetical protein
MSEGNLLKYLKYALGEILLVVVGILIALQINNWNENRKKQNLEKHYLNRLISDLQADIQEIDITVQFARESIVIGNDILELVGYHYLPELVSTKDTNVVAFIHTAFKTEESDVTEENIGSSIGLLFDERIVDMNDFTYNELISTGNFEAIRNPDLRKDLTKYYLGFKAVLDIQDNLLFAIDDFNLMLRKNNIPIINTFSLGDLSTSFNTSQGVQLQTALKNLIWNHANSISVFQYEFKPQGIKLIEDITAYSEGL